MFYVRITKMCGEMNDMKFDKSTDQLLVFISYSHRDRELCKQLSEILESKTEVHVWYDKELMAGEAFRKKIVEAI